MTGYVLLENYNNSDGKLGISTKVFETLAKKCLKQTKEIVKDKNTIVQASVKNNAINYKIVAYVKKGIKKDNIKQALENEINSSLLLFCEAVLVNLNIKIIEKEIEA